MTVRQTIGPLPDASDAAVEAALGSDEAVDAVAATVGSALVLTDRRLLVVREGANYRSASGIRSFALDGNLRVRLEPLRKRVLIGSGRATISVFVRSGHLDVAEELLAEVRRRIQFHGRTTMIAVRPASALLDLDRGPGLPESLVPRGWGDVAAIVR